MIGPRYTGIINIKRGVTASIINNNSTLLNGLVSYYKMDETSGNAIDSVSGYNGTNTNVTQNSTGKINTSYTYNGSSSKTVVSDTNALDLTSAGGFSVWIYPTSASYNYVIDKCNDSSNTNGYFILLYESNIVLLLCNATTNTSLVSNGTVTLNAWNHIVCTWGSGNMYIYINGTLDKSSSTSVTPVASTYNLYIGAPISDSGYFSGRIDEIGIWNRLVTSSEVASLYNSGNGYAYPFN